MFLQQVCRLIDLQWVYRNKKYFSATFPSLIYLVQTMCSLSLYMCILFFRLELKLLFHIYSIQKVVWLWNKCISRFPLLSTVCFRFPEIHYSLCVLKCSVFTLVPEWFSVSYSDFGVYTVLSWSYFYWPDILSNYL